MPDCPTCGVDIEAESTICHACGAPVETSPSGAEAAAPAVVANAGEACRVCGAPLPSETEACVGCGTPVRRERPTLELDHAHKCLACGNELEPEATACEECGTLVPDYKRPVMDHVYQEGPSETSRLALWSAALVVLGFCIPFAPLAALVLGVMAIREINESEDHLGGRAFATFGLVGGGVFGFGHILFLVPAFISMMAGGPGLVGLAGGGSEQAGIAGLKKIYEAQSMARFSVAFDRDQDGIGEYTSMELLASGHLPYLRKDLARGSAGGYWLQVVVPDDADEAELYWWGIALPQNRNKGWRTFVVDHSGVILAKDTKGEQPDLADLSSWEPVDRAVSQFDSDVQQSRWKAQEMQRQQARALTEIGY